jgi:hypothetical protein
VSVRSTVVNQSTAAPAVSLQVQLVNPDGKVVGTAETKPRRLAAGESSDFTQELSVRSPVRWHITNPALYQAVARVRAGRRVFDDEAVTFGIREFEFEPATSGNDERLGAIWMYRDKVRHFQGGVAYGPRRPAMARVRDRPGSPPPPASCKSKSRADIVTTGLLRRLSRR